MVPSAVLVGKLEQAESLELEPHAGRHTPGQPDRQYRLTDDQRLAIRELSLQGQLTQRQIALRVGTTPQTVNAVLKDRIALAKSMLDAAATDAASAVIASFKKRPQIAMDYLDRKKAIEPPQTSAAFLMPTIIFQSAANIGVGVTFQLPHLPQGQPALSPAHGVEADVIESESLESLAK